MSVRQLVNRERTSLRRSRLIGGAAETAAVTLALLAVCALALGQGRWIAAPRWLPMLGTLIVVVVAAVLARRAYRAASADSSSPRVAESIERAQALREGALRASIELEGTGPLADAGARSLDARLQGVDSGLAPALRSGAARLTMRAGIAATAAAAVLLILAPTYGDGLRAVMRPVGAWRGKLLPTPTLDDVPASIARGRTFRVRAAAQGRSTVTLRERQTGAAWKERAIQLGGEGSAWIDVGPLNADLHLLLTDGRASTAEHVVRVTERAYVGNVVVRATPPRYLGGATERVSAGEPIRVPRGTLLEISGDGSTALRAIALASAADTVSMTTAGQRFAGSVRADRDTRWEWVAVAADGGDLEKPNALNVEVAADSAPQIAIALPEGDTLVMADGRATLRLVASDDHGLSRVALNVVHATGAPATRELARDLPARWAADAALDAAALGLRPGDAVRVSAEATDNSPWAQTARSRSVVLRLPGLAEQREMARASADSLARAAAAAVGAERDLAKRTGEASRSRGDRGARQASGSTDRNAAARQPNDGLSYEGEQAARALRSEQQTLSQAVDKMREQAHSLERSLSRAGALDSALASRLAEAQQLLREAMTPDMARALAQLDTALQTRQSDRARESLADLAREQEKLRAQLERIAEMLGRAAIEGSMETLRDEANDVAKAERALADSAPSSGSKSEEARALADRSAALAKGIDKLGERLKQAGSEPTARATSQAGKLATASGEGMRRAATASPSGASDAAHQASDQMTRAAEQLGQAREQQIGAWKSELAAELDRSIQEMLQLAGEQRALEQRSRDGAAPGTLRSEQSALQQGVEKTSERLERAARASSLVSGGARRSVSEARSQTARATEESAKPNGRSASATSAMGDAADALTKAAAALVKDRERVNSSSSATGFAEMLREMQELAKKQGSLNGQSAGLFQMPSQSGAARDGARQMAREQRGVARSLDELGDADGSGRSEALAAEARRIAEALERGDLSAATRERQERLFKRMLDAGRSLEGDERDDEGKREARAADGVQVFAPAAGTAKGAAGARFREPAWDDLRGLSADERRAVIDYFRRLNGGAR